MKCVLHIGTEKTGTTTLQEFFVSNEKPLLEQNCKITKSLGTINNSGLIQIANKNLLSSHVKTVRDMDDISYDLFIKDRAIAFENEIKDVKWPNERNKKKVLLSSEFLQSHLRISDIKNLKNNLKKIGFKEFQIVLVLRPQSEVVLSRISTGVIAGNHYKFLNDKNIIHLPGKFPRSYDYYQTINDWSEIFGERSLTILDFNKIKSSSLEINFLNAVDPNLIVKNLKTIKRKNVSLPFKVILSLNKLNKDYKIKFLERKNLNTKIRKMESEKVDYALGKVAIEKINKYFLEGNKKIEEKYKVNLNNEYRELMPKQVDFDKDYKLILSFLGKS
jgi:hypothetical protein